MRKSAAEIADAVLEKCGFRPLAQTMKRVGGRAKGVLGQAAKGVQGFNAGIKQSPFTAGQGVEATMRGLAEKQRKQTE